MNNRQATSARKISLATWAACLILVGISLQPAHAEEVSAQLDLSNYQGKIVWLDFWASWCVPCRRSFPWLNEVLARYDDDEFVVIGVNLDKDPLLVREFLEATPADFPIIYDPDGQLATEYGVVGMPSSFIIGRDGKIIADHIGFKRDRIADYEKSIRNAVVQ